MIAALILIAIVILITLVAWDPCNKAFPMNHEWERTYCSNEELFKDGRMPLRLPMGGIRKYTCKTCGKEKSESWSAFD